MRTVMGAAVAWAVGTVLAGGAARGECGGCAPTGHLGVALKAVNGRLETGVYVFDETNPATVDVGVRVWGGQPFQINPYDPYWTDLPCYGATTDSGLPPGSQVGFNILDDLKYWDGQGPVQFGPVPSDEKLIIRYGFNKRCAATGTGFVSGFNFQTVPGDGAFHRHLSYYLAGPNDNCTTVPPALTVPPADGIYLLKLQMTSTAGLEASQPIWLVFRNFAPERTDAENLHCMALLWVAHHLAADRPRADLDFDRDVDVDDLARLEACASGPGMPYSEPCCSAADLDDDGDVDMVDFGVWQRCHSGPGQTAAVDCGS